VHAVWKRQARRAKVDADVALVESEEAAQRALRAKYWHEFNEFNFQLQAHMEERDAVLARIESTCEARERLRQAAVAFTRSPPSTTTA
jgi:beclin 1